jgi:hypothetical protein
MRIGIMLRAIDEKGGVSVYSRNIVAELLQLDRKNEYVLFYRNPENIGRFAHHPNVREQLVQAANKAVWDQIAIPRACRREQNRRAVPSQVYRTAAGSLPGGYDSSRG